MCDCKIVGVFARSYSKIRCTQADTFRSTFCKPRENYGCTAGSLGIKNELDSVVVAADLSCFHGLLSVSNCLMVLRTRME